jgi:hypothetical protein
LASVSDPDLDEKFDLPQDTDPDDVLRRLLSTGDGTSKDVSEDETQA